MSSDAPRFRFKLIPFLAVIVMGVGISYLGFALAELRVLYAYWQEKSRSVVAPSIGHNVSDGLEFTIEYAWIAFL